MRAAFIAAECEPFAKTGGLGDVVDALARALPKAREGAFQVAGSNVPGRAGGLRGGGRTDAVEPVTVFIPRYRGMNVPADARRLRVRVPDPRATDGLSDVEVMEFEARGYLVRLVDFPAAFDRDGYYGDKDGDYPDNGWRFGMLCRTALETLRADGRPIDVLNLHDWQAQPAVLYRDTFYADDPLISRAAVVVTIHNLAYQGWIPRAAVLGLGFAREMQKLLKPGADGLLLLREGIVRAEIVNTVSPGYAAEVRTKAFGMGMDPLLRSLGDRFLGIINGLDMAVWDPATDSDLRARYSAADLGGKAACRRALLSELGFDPESPSPLFGMIGRLDPQKGFDLLAGATPEIVAAGGRVVALGTGDLKLVAELRKRAADRPDAVAVVEAFDRALARRIYAGADLFVMPSRFEPCGQGQMISLRYGTPAVVNRTGGLADTVVDADEHPESGTGFVFDEPTVAAFTGACRRAMKCYREGPDDWMALQARGMAIDWSWEAGPAQQYADAYAHAIAIRQKRVG